MRRGFLLESTKKGKPNLSNVFRREENQRDSPPSSVARHRSSSSSEIPPVTSDASDGVVREETSSASSPVLLSRYGDAIDAIGDIAEQSLENMSRGFSRPRCRSDAFNALRGSQREDPNCISRFMDLHIWCVDDQNNILDYPIDQIESWYWTDDVVYRPFDAQHVRMIYDDVMHFAKRNETYINVISKMSQEEKMKAIEENTFPKKNCMWRALALQNSDPLKYSIVFGSLGFRQRSGKIFWEYG